MIFINEKNRRILVNIAQSWDEFKYILKFNKTNKIILTYWMNIQKNPKTDI
jgi:hypothetical protein